MCQNTRKFSVQFPPETEDSVRNTEQLIKRWEGRTLFPSSLPPEQEEHNIPCMVCLPSLFPPEPNKPTTLIWIAVCVHVLIVNCSLFILLNDIQLVYYPCLTSPVPHILILQKRKLRQTEEASCLNIQHVSSKANQKYMECLALTKEELCFYSLAES